jgi:DNA-binding response OmpR family regulator
VSHGVPSEAEHPQSPKLLVVDDDPALRRLLEAFLQQHDYAVVLAATAHEAWSKLQRDHYHAVILDMMMPGEDGLSLLGRIRRFDEQLPVLMLSARGDDVDRIVGLELGADDYLAKPANPREVLARIRALLRRQPRTRPTLPELSVVTLGNCTVNLKARTAQRGKQTIALTSYDVALLSVLLRHPEQPLTRDQIVSLVQGKSIGANARSVDVAIAKLRKIVEPEAQQPRYLQTIWGVGYIYVPDHE